MNHSAPPGCLRCARHYWALGIHSNTANNDSNTIISMYHGTILSLHGGENVTVLATIYNYTAPALLLVHSVPAASHQDNRGTSLEIEGKESEVRVLSIFKSLGT